MIRNCRSAARRVLQVSPDPDPDSYPGSGDHGPGMRRRRRHRMQRRPQRRSPLSSDSTAGPMMRHWTRIMGTRWVGMEPGQLC
eukprot:754217-Hanusia_phi.AAC.1